MPARIDYKENARKFAAMYAPKPLTEDDGEAAKDAAHRVRDQRQQREDSRPIKMPKGRSVLPRERK